MVSCYDCEEFGTRCAGIVPPLEFKDRIDALCPLFRVLPWRDELYKPSGSARIS